jgi:hypothetical protein
MTNMNLPGFTGEASVYDGRHREMAAWAHGLGALGQPAIVPQAMAGLSGSQRLAGGGGWQCWYIWGCVICCTPSWCWYICRAGTASLSTTTIH